jgi:3-hydroxyacyl-CoA dehydrogenase
MVRESRRGEIAHDPGYCLIADRLHEKGRFGQKSSRGFYVYEERDQRDDPEVDSMARDIAEELQIERRAISDQEIFERCLYSLINEGAEILREGIAYRSGDCDLIWVNGYGFPVWRGGPMHYAGEIGLDAVLAGIEKYRNQLGEYGDMWFQPSPLLRELAEQGKTFSEFKPV